MKSHMLWNRPFTRNRAVPKHKIKVKTVTIERVKLTRRQWIITPMDDVLHFLAHPKRFITNPPVTYICINRVHVSRESSESRRGSGPMDMRAFLHKEKGVRVQDVLDTFKELEFKWKHTVGRGSGQVVAEGYILSFDKVTGLEPETDTLEERMESI